MNACTIAPAKVTTVTGKWKALLELEPGKKGVLKALGSWRGQFSAVSLTDWRSERGAGEVAKSRVRGGFLEAENGVVVRSLTNKLSGRGQKTGQTRTLIYTLLQRFTQATFKLIRWLRVHWHRPTPPPQALRQLSSLNRSTTIIIPPLATGGTSPSWIIPWV